MAWAVIIAFLGTLYVPTFIWLVQAWLSDPYYGHGFLIPLISGFVVWRNRHELKRTQPSLLGVILFGLGLVIYVIGFLWGMRFLSAISLLPVLAGLTLHFYGTRAARSMAFPICFLLFMVPPQFLNDVGYWMQSLSSQW